MSQLQPPSFLLCGPSLLNPRPCHHTMISHRKQPSRLSKTRVLLPDIKTSDEEKKGVRKRRLKQVILEDLPPRLIDAVEKLTVVQEEPTQEPVRSPQKIRNRNFSSLEGQFEFGYDSDGFDGPWIPEDEQDIDEGSLPEVSPKNPSSAASNDEVGCCVFFPILAYQTVNTHPLLILSNRSPVFLQRNR